MTIVAVLHSIAERDEILIGVDHAPLHGPSRPGVVAAIIQCYPPPLEFLVLANLAPCPSTAHELDLVAPENVSKLPSDNTRTGNRSREGCCAITTQGAHVQAKS